MSDEEYTTADENEVESYIHYHEYDFEKISPTLVIRGLFGSIGYDVNKDTGELTRCCICAAHSDNECCCGYFDHLD